MTDAREYARRGLAIMDAPGADAKSAPRRIASRVPIRDAWRQKNYRLALQEADVILRDPRFPSGVIGAGHAYTLLYLYLRLGRWDRIEELASRMVPPITGSRFLIVATSERGEQDQVRDLMRKHMAKYNEVIGGSSVLGIDVVSALIDAGMLDLARQTQAALKRAARPDGPMVSQFIEGLVASADGRLGHAVPLLSALSGSTARAQRSVRWRH